MNQKTPTKCPVCGGSLHPNSSPFSVASEKQVEAPALICQNCGEAFFENAVAERLEKLAFENAEGEISDEKWLKNAATNPVFDFLKSTEEDVYSRTDGQPMPS